MTVSRKALSLIAAGLVALSAVPASAEYSPRVRNACSGDAQRLCPKQKPGSNEMRYCMEARASSLSRGCVRALEDEGLVPRGYLRR
jgi:hypothetical protein